MIFTLVLARRMQTSAQKKNEEAVSREAERQKKGTLLAKHVFTENSKRNRLPLMLLRQNQSLEVT
jgi:hypothetical protein